jgi:hypothetical protein
MQVSDPVTGKMPVPQVLLLKGQHYITNNCLFNLTVISLTITVISLTIRVISLTITGKMPVPQ